LDLSDVIPHLEIFGLRVLSEHPFKVEPAGDEVIWLHKYGLSHSFAGELDVDAVQQKFEDDCQMIWQGVVENDPFNKLVLAAQLNWQQVLMLRAYSRYLKQAAFPASHHFIAETLVRYHDLARKIV